MPFVRETFIALLAVVLLAAAVSSSAADERDDARVAYERAETHYAMGEFAAAVTQYKKAYELSKAPALLFNIAQALRLDGKDEDALYFYETYLRLEKSPPNRTDVEAHIASLKQTIAERRDREKSDSERARAEADRRRLEAEIAARHARTREARARAELARSYPPPRRRNRVLEAAGLITAGVGAVAVGGGIYLAVEAKDKFDTVNATEAWSAELDRTLDDAQSRRTQAIVLSAVGGSALVGGGILYFLGRRGSAVGERSLTVSPTRGGARVAWRWRF